MLMATAGVALSEASWCVNTARNFEHTSCDGQFNLRHALCNWMLPIEMTVDMESVVSSSPIRIVLLLLRDADSEADILTIAL